MLLKSIHLNNIRSYVDQKINFNNGVVVLSGDIGSGKSSILLAVEFALFGINDSGNSLLRNGAGEGYVELTFDINNKEHTIRRYLKRKAEGVRQANGYVVIDNTKKDLTPVELKQFIISLLGYPQESLNKKSQVYRYTTYTPQDEMKQILYGDSEERISIIRKIFGVDKYQRVVENSAVFTRYLRENKREILGRVSDLDSKKIEILKLNEEKTTLTSKEKEIDARLTEAKRIVEELKLKLANLESEVKRVNEVKKEKSDIESSIKHKEEQIVLINNDVIKINSEIINLKDKASPERILELKTKVKLQLKDEISSLERTQLELQKKIGEFEALKNHSEKIKKQISELQDCPLCLQNVHHEHKHKITSSEDEKIRDIEVKLKETTDKITEAKNNLSNKNLELNQSNQAEREMTIMLLYIKNMTEKESSINNKKELSDKIANEINEFKNKLSNIKTVDFNEKEFLELKTSFEKSQLNERNVEIEKTRTSTELKNIERIESLIKKEIEEKEKLKVNINEITKLEEWLQKNFTNIVYMIEKHVLSNIYFTFNDSFSEMFDMLIEDERLTSRINENFTPVIEQNGFETEFENLSGGEKTSLCLAYRLALNKSVNNILSNIKTRDLLVLDEPTDGFSSEQIDKMKDLFDKINSQQTIIVSHENKIESIADHVIRIVKSGHESKVLA